MVAGYTWTQQHATYNFIGETVNLSACIEEYIKQAGKPILIDKFTREGLPDRIEVESICEVTFKGKQQPVGVFAVKMG